MPGIFEHIHFQRETFIKERRGRSFPPPEFKGNPSDHAKSLSGQLEITRKKITEEETPGYDNRLLLKLNLREGFDPSGFESIEGIQILSQENKEIVIMFATESALAEFEKRLATYGSTGSVTRKDLIEALKEFNLWSAEDRKGDVLKREGFPATETFTLDVELWPNENRSERDKMYEAFQKWTSENDLVILDKILNNYLSIVRLKCNHHNQELLFHHRDVRTIDLPPKYTLEYSLLQTDISEIPVPIVPSESAPKIAILDSGLNTGHPLLKSAVGDSRSYIDGQGSEDQTGHGTAVAGIALYGDVAEAIHAKSFIPQFWILSGRILDNNNDYNDKFIENQIEKAVREFHSEYECKIFNLSIGDERRPYSGGKPGTFPMTLDNLSYELGVIFITSTGNLRKADIKEILNNHGKYPDYLLNNSEILEPSNAINALTVGSIARYDQSRTAARFTSDPAYQPLANKDSISPFSRLGHGIGGCIKPEIVAYGGNLSYDARSHVLLEHGHGELSLNHSYSEGKLFSEHYGTSFSAPFVTYLLGRLLSNYHQHSILLQRALLVSSAKSEFLKLPDSLSDNDKLRMVGYGKVDEEHLYKSGEEVVILYAIDKIQNDKNHFYEIPLPDEYFKGRRKREISVTLSYFSPVRNTRVNYRGIRMFFKFVKGNSIEQVVKMFDKTTSEEQYENIPEYDNNRNITFKNRSKGTVQSSTWTLKQPNGKSKFFIAVTRNDFPWGEKVARDKEEYALTIILRDPEHSEPRLYTRIAEMIKQRVRGRSTV